MKSTGKILKITVITNSCQRAIDKMNIKQKKKKKKKAKIKISVESKTINCCYQNGNNISARKKR